MIPYLEKTVITNHASALRERYAHLTGRIVEYPLPLEDIFYDVFGLETIYDTQGILNRIEVGILGCLFPDGHPSPFNGKDKIIAVNQTCATGFDPRHYGAQHTIAHEGMGHYVLHFLKGVNGNITDRPSYCRTNQKDPLEWQSDFAAGELTQPADKVAWILDGKTPPEIINVEVYERNYRDFFGTTRGGMEARLKVLGYKMVNARYAWAAA